MILDRKLNFNNLISDKISKANKGIGAIRRLYKLLFRTSLINIYKAVIRPHLDYGDIIYDNSSNAIFSQMIESVQYNAALAIHGSSRDKLYQELGFESLHDRRLFRKLCFYYKIQHNNCPLYLIKLLPTMETNCYSLRSNRPRTVLKVRTTGLFKSTFSPPALLIGINLALTYKIKRALLSFIRPNPAEVYKFNIQKD